MQDDAPRLRAIVEAAVDARSAMPLLLRDVAGVVTDAAAVTHQALARGNKVVLFGNGGSASQAQHLATELVGRFRLQRAPLAAVALTADTALLTALANDYGYETVFARQVVALGLAGDVAIAISTSGRSENVLRATAAAREIGMHVVALTGQAPNALADAAEVAIAVPSTDTQVVQEAHLAIGHIICEVVEELLHPVPRSSTEA